MSSMYAVWNICDCELRDRNSLGLTDDKVKKALKAGWHVNELHETVITFRNASIKDDFVITNDFVITKSSLIEAFRNESFQYIKIFLHKCKKPAKKELLTVDNINVEVLVKNMLLITVQTTNYI